jgi:hypothetical protein
MNSRRFRQLESVSDSPHTLKHPKGSKELEGEFLISSRRHRGLYVWLQLQKDHVTHCKLAFRTVLISLPLHTVLSPNQVLSDQ